MERSKIRVGVDASRQSRITLRSIRATARFTLPCRGRVDRPTGPARSGRPDGRLRRAGWGARHRR